MSSLLSFFSTFQLKSHSPIPRHQPTPNTFPSNPSPSPQLTSRTSATEPAARLPWRLPTLHCVMVWMGKTPSFSGRRAAWKNVSHCAVTTSGEILRSFWARGATWCSAPPGFCATQFLWELKACRQKLRICKSQSHI